MLSSSRAEVRTKIVTSSKEIPISYRLIQKGGSWKVYDVVIGGVSLVTTYRKIHLFDVDTGQGEPYRESATVMPGDIVLGKREGVIFIPPHLAEKVVTTSEVVRLRDLFGMQRLREGKGEDVIKLQQQLVGEKRARAEIEASLAKLGGPLWVPSPGHSSLLVWRTAAWRQPARLWPRRGWAHQSRAHRCR